jgi:uracil-DNA glycosylase
VSTSVKDAADFVPETNELAVLGEAVQRCRGCELYRKATQAIFGESLGNTKTEHGIEIMMIGEQPGDKEDIAGHPFVGPAGKLLMQCLYEAEIDSKQVYITNAVKHFKWVPRGKIRLHKKPTITEVKACKPWLEAEIDSVKPKLIVCLGATAAQSLLGPKFRVSESRGRLQEVGNSPPIVATVHPASILRAQSDEDRQIQTKEFISDLRRAKKYLDTI